MLDGKRVAVVVPAFDEEQLIGTTLAGIPEFVDILAALFWEPIAARMGRSAA